jgi:cell division protein FtsB
MQANFIYNLVKKYNISKVIFIAYFIGFAVFLYLLIFIIFGNKGLIEMFALEKKINDRQIVKEKLISEIEEKKQKVESMNLNSLDIDLLDEQARKVLGYAGKNEVVIYQEKNND